jgi:hypothetical protein
MNFRHKSKQGIFDGVIVWIFFSFSFFFFLRFAWHCLCRVYNLLSLSRRALSWLDVIADEGMTHIHTYIYETNSCLDEDGSEWRLRSQHTTTSDLLFFSSFFFLWPGQGCLLLIGSTHFFLWDWATEPYFLAAGIAHQIQI